MKHLNDLEEESSIKLIHKKKNINRLTVYFCLALIETNVIYKTFLISHIQQLPNANFILMK